MTDTINDGGPAFPITAGNQVYAQGMRLRDAAALAALQGIISSTPQVRVTEAEAEAWPGIAARAAWRMADAFIATREGKSDD